MAVNLLQKCISSASVCKRCRSRDGILEIFERPSERSGMAESLFAVSAKASPTFKPVKKFLLIHRKVNIEK